MPSYNDFDLLDELEDLDSIPHIKNIPRKERGVPHRRRSNHKPKVSQAEILNSLVEKDDDRFGMAFTYNASKNEALWLRDSLLNFYQGHWFDDILHIVKGGKEASVYQCRGNATTQSKFIAAKVYRPRMFRSLKNDSLYREGRSPLDEDGNEIINGGMKVAMAKKTGYGLQLLHTSWIEHEVKALKTLSQAGCNVPTYYASGDNAILMEYIGGPEMAAPILNSITLDQDEAHELFEGVLRTITRMLENRIVHGDLSAYNMLYWEGKITLIDFPQIVDPTSNRNAYRIFCRDVVRVCEYFSRQGVRSDPKKIARDLWTSFGFSIQPDVHPGLLDDEDETDRAYWERLQKDM